MVKWWFLMLCGWLFVLLVVLGVVMVLVVGGVIYVSVCVEVDVLFDY